MTSIGYDAFSNCSSLTSIVVESGNTVYDSRNDCNAIIKTATNTLIAGCKNTIIPNSVTSIGSYAFYDCRSLTSITIPSSVTSIGNHAFYDCRSLTSITIPSSVTSIGNYAFDGCTSLTSVTLDNNAIVSADRRPDNSMKSIFGNQVRTYVLGNSVTRIGKYAFDDCTSLTSVTIPSSVTSIGEYTYYNCTSLTSVTIGSGVTSIGRYAFDGCSSLTAVTIPSSVTSIGEYAFSECRSLTSIIVDSGNTVYDSRNNCNAIIRTATNTLIVGCKNTIIPNSVTYIGSSAFYGCSNLTSITIPNSVTSIRRYAFYGCSNLTSIIIPSSVTIIGEYAFSYCISLTDVYCYAENVPSTDSDAFKNSFISSATLHVPAGSIEAYRTTAPWSSFGSIVAIE